jgi:hypothetical protein
VEIDPFSSLTGALSKTGKYTMNTFQVNFRPASSKSWKKDAKRTIKILISSYPKILKKILLHPAYKYFRILMFPVVLLGKFISLLIRRNQEDNNI